MNLASPTSFPLRRSLLWPVVFAIATVILVLAGAACWFVSEAYGRTYTDRLFPGIKIFQTDLGGRTATEAQTLLSQTIQQQGLTRFEFVFNGNPIIIDDPEHKLVRYQIRETIDHALQLGRDHSWLNNNLSRLKLRLHPQTITLAASVDDQSLLLLLQDKIKQSLTNPRNAELHVALDPNRTEPNITIDAEQDGFIPDLPQTLELFKQQVSSLTFKPIHIPATPIEPEKTAAAIQPLLPEINTWLAHNSFQLSTDHAKNINVTSSTVANWLNAVTSTQGVVLGLDPERVQATLEKQLASLIVPVKDGLLVVDENNHLVSLDNPQEGTRVDAYATIRNIQEGWKANSSTIPIVLQHQTPLMLGADASRLGIQDIIGIGTSNFAGSPTNRRKNIALGAKKVNGALIPPGEVFSMLKTLGVIDEANGWFKELVIKDNKTEPEFGGGLCQIGTTAFRGALSSGLPITMRANHSYRVPYYEPAGTDATIYDPAPDFRFRNDTGNWILITTAIKGDDVAFTFWGTDDQREILQSKPRVYNIVPPPEKKIVETLDLPPGTTKCTERAHAGADASFDYTVTYPNGETKKVTFNSHYKPWGAVCLLGVTHLTASSTDMIDESGVNNPN